MHKPQGDILNVWISNFSTEAVVLEPDMLLVVPADVEHAESLLAHAQQSVEDKALADGHLLSLSQDTEVKAEENDWEWRHDEQLSMPVDGVPVDDADPPTEASLQQLRQACVSVTAKLSAAMLPEAEAQAEDVNALIMKAKRLNDRIMLHQQVGPCEDKELPPTLSFEKGYGHLSPKQLQQVKPPS